MEENNKKSSTNEVPATNQASAPSTDSGKNNSTYRAMSMVLVVLVSITLVALIYSAATHKNTKQATTSALSSLQPAQVAIKRTGFSPTTVTIKAGQSVTWTNRDKVAHKVNSDPYPTDDTLPGLNSKIKLVPNSTFSYTFEKPGTYLYHDDLNPYKLKGTIVVQ